MHNSRRPFSSRIVRENCDDDFNRNIQILNVYYYYYYNSFIYRSFRVALPAQPLSSNLVLRPERNRAKWPTGIRRSATGRPFQAIGPDTEKALSDNSPCMGDQLLCLHRRAQCDVMCISSSTSTLQVPQIECLKEE